MAPEDNEEAHQGLDEFNESEEDGDDDDTGDSDVTSVAASPAPVEPVVANEDPPRPAKWDSEFSDEEKARIGTEPTAEDEAGGGKCKSLGCMKPVPPNNHGFCRGHSN